MARAFRVAHVNFLNKERRYTMGILKDFQSALHRIKVNLHPNCLPNYEGTYFAKSDNEATLGIERICSGMKDRGGFTGRYEDLLENVKQFLDEAVYQLCDGYSVNLGYFCIYPNIGGTFESVDEPYDEAKHPVTFRFRTNAKLRRMAEHIEVEVKGECKNKARIGKFTDLDENSVNKIYVPGDMFSITGSKIKIAGDNPDCGLYFVPEGLPDKAVKVKRIMDNKPSKSTGIAPLTEHTCSRVEIRTQYTGSKTVYLKEPRTITSSFVLDEE
jgi:hypothetical protein